MSMKDRKKYGQQGTFSAHGSSSQKVGPPTLSSPKLLQSLLVAKGELRHQRPPSRRVTINPLTLPDLTTSWSLELMFSEDLADLDFLTGAILSVLVVG